jgi:hypothetical protein
MSNNIIIARVLEAPRKCILSEKLSLPYAQIMATMKMTAKHTAKMILPVLSIFLGDFLGAIYTFTGN